jgi:hypothetical protein
MAVFEDQVAIREIWNRYAAQGREHIGVENQRVARQIWILMGQRGAPPPAFIDTRGVLIVDRSRARIQD